MFHSSLYDFDIINTYSTITDEKTADALAKRGPFANVARSEHFFMAAFNALQFKNLFSPSHACVCAGEFFILIASPVGR